MEPQPRNPYPQIPISSIPYEPPKAYQMNEQEKPPNVYEQPNKPYPYYPVPPPLQYGPQGPYAIGQPAFFPEVVGNPYGQPFYFSKIEQKGIRTLNLK